MQENEICEICGDGSSIEWDCPCCGRTIQEPRNLAKPEASSRLLCEILSDRAIEQVATDECQNIDADSLGIRDVYYGGFVAGAKWAREKAKNFA